MKTLELENSGLALITNIEMQKLNGGLASFISVTGIWGFLVGEASDLIDGFKAGYNATTSVTIQG